MEVAHMYRITGLVRYCANFLQSVLQPDNACEILEMALFYDQEGLRDAAVEFIDDNASQVLESDGFLRISHSCLIYILKGDTFYANEAAIFKSVEKWAINKQEDKERIPDGKLTREALGEAFTYLRVPTMAIGDFLRCTKRRGYYTLEETEDILDYMSSETKDIDTVSCHSSIQRMPRLNAQNVETMTYKTSSYESQIECCFLAKVSKDCYIEEFTINELKPYILTAGMEQSLAKEVLVSRYEKNYSGYEISFKYDMKVDLLLKGMLKCPELDFRKNFEIRVQDGRSVTLEEPLFLRKKTEPYCFNICLTFDCSYNGVRLQGCSNNIRNAGSCTAYRHSEECKNRLETAAKMSKDSVTFSYCRSSEHINSLQSFMVHNFANRDNKT